MILLWEVAIKLSKNNLAYITLNIYQWYFFLLLRIHICLEILHNDLVGGIFKFHKSIYKEKTANFLQINLGQSSYSIFQYILKSDYKITQLRESSLYHGQDFMCICVNFEYICNAGQGYFLHLILNHSFLHFLVKALECIYDELGICRFPVLLKVIQEILRYCSNEIILVKTKSMYLDE